MLDRKGDRFQADFGFHLGAVDCARAARRRRRGVLVVTACENVQGIEGGIIVLFGVVGRQRNLDV
ncbi:hypothetical protein D3C87_1784830 [compost metagenome]